MQRAAAGLAYAVLDLLGAGVRRAGCCCSSARATTAATRCTPARCWRGAGRRCEARAAGPKVHAGGLAALRAAGGRVVDAVDDAPAARRRGGRHRRHRRAAAGCGRTPRRRCARWPGVPVVAVDVPSGVDVDTGRLDGAARARRRDGHLRHPQGRPPRRPGGDGLRGGAPRRHRARPARRRGRGAPGRRRAPRCCRGPAPDAHKYTRGVVGVRAGSEQLPGRRRALRRPARRPGWPGWCATSAAARRRRCAREHPEVVVGEGRVQAWVVGSGGDADAEQALADALGDGVPDRGGRRRARRTSTGPLDGPRAAHPARRRAGPDARRRAGARSRPTSSRFARARPQRVRRRGAAQGPAHAGRRTRRAGAGRPPRARPGWPPPAPATCSPGSSAPCWPPGWTRSTPARSAPGCTAPRPPLASGGGPDHARRDVAGARCPAVVRATCLAWMQGRAGAMARWAHRAASRSARRDRGRPRRDPAQRRHAARPGGAPTASDADGRGEGRRLRPRDGPGGPGRPRRPGADWLGVATAREALALRAAGDTGRVLSWLAVPGDGLRRRGRGGRRRDGVHRWPSSTRSPRRRRRPAAGPACSSRSTPGCPAAARPPSDWPALVAAARAERGRRRRGSPASGRTSPAPTSRTTPPTTSRRRPSATPSRSPTRPASARGAPPRQLRRRAAAPEQPLRPGPLRHRGVRPRPGPRRVSPDARAGAGDDRARARWPSPSRSPPAPASPTATPGPRRGDTRWAWCRWGTATACRATPATRAEVLVDGKRRPILGRVCMDQFVVDLGDDLTTARRRATRSCCSARATAGEPTAQDWARGLRHHLLRDRHPDGRPPAPALRRRRGRMKASSKVLSVAGAAVGVAAAGTALRVAQRRAVIARRGAGDETEFGSLRSAPITVVAVLSDDGDRVEKATGLAALGEIDDIAIVAAARRGAISTTTSCAVRPTDALIAPRRGAALPDRGRRRAAEQLDDRDPRVPRPVRQHVRARSTTRGSRSSTRPQRPRPGAPPPRLHAAAVGLRGRHLRPQRHRARRATRRRPTRSCSALTALRDRTSTTAARTCSTRRASTPCASSRAAATGSGARAR